MSDLFKNYIAGEWVESVTGETFERRNPATGELIGVYTKSGPADVERAVAAASKAFKSWRLFPAPNHDAATIQRILGPLPLAGLFAQGELGPVGGRNYIHGYTASVALFE